MEQVQNQSGEDKAHNKCEVKSLEHSYKSALPEIIMKEVEHLLHLVAHVYKDGGEMPMLFVGMDADGGGHLIDPSDLPIKAMVPPAIKRVLDKMNAVAVIGATEGWTIPDASAKEWEKTRQKGDQIKDHPEAYEVFFIQVETLNGIWFAKGRVSAHVGEGTPRTVEPLVFDRMGNADGQFSNLLKQNRPADEAPMNPLLEMLMDALGGFQQVTPDGKPIDEQTPTKH